MRTVLSLLVGLVAFATPALAQKSTPRCVEVSIALPVKTDTFFYGVRLDIGVDRGEGKHSTRFPDPAVLAVCNGMKQATRDELEKAGYKAYDFARFYYRNDNVRSRMYAGLHMSRGVVIYAGMPERDSDGMWFVRVKLPTGKPLHIGFSVCSRDTWSWALYTGVWDGGRGTFHLGKTPASTEADAYQKGGRCHHYDEWSRAGSTPPRTDFFFKTV